MTSHRQPAKSTSSRTEVGSRQDPVWRQSSTEVIAAENRLLRAQAEVDRRERELEETRNRHGGQLQLNGRQKPKEKSAGTSGSAQDAVAKPPNLTNLVQSQMGQNDACLIVWLAKGQSQAEWTEVERQSVRTGVTSDVSSTLDEFLKKIV